MIVQDRFECPYCGWKHDEDYTRKLVKIKGLHVYQKNISLVCRSCKMTNILKLTKYGFINFYPVQRDRAKRYYERINETEKN